MAVQVSQATYDEVAALVAQATNQRNNATETAAALTADAAAAEARRVELAAILADLEVTPEA